MRVTTAHLLSDLALQETCGQQCVEWAIGMLESGHESHSLLRLAGMLPPYNHFEIAALTDRALNELHVNRKPPVDAALAYAAELLGSALAGEIDIVLANSTVAELSIALDYQRELSDFTMLYWAHKDLQYGDVQWYWDGATCDNIREIMRQRAEEFLAKRPKTT